MHSCLAVVAAALAADDTGTWWINTLMFVKVLIGFSIIIFVHELGHFLAAKWVGIRVDRFSVGFTYRLCGWRRGEGFTFGKRPEYKQQELREKGYGETDYCFKALPFGGYVKMLGQDDIVIDEKTGDVQMSDDPRAFTNRPVGQRMIVASAGVIFNLLFAAVLLTCVFLLGKKMVAPVVGELMPDSPARGKLFPLDRIVEIDGKQIKSFKEIIVATILSDGPLHLRVERGGALLDEGIIIEPKPDEQEDLPTLGILPMVTTKCTQDSKPVGDRPHVKADDEIISIDGQPVESKWDIELAFAQGTGAVREVTVRRPPGKGEEGPGQIIQCAQRAQLVVGGAGPPGEGAETYFDNCHILGFQRRRAIGHVDSGEPADKAGFELGDVILEWDRVAHPLCQEILDSIKANPGKPLRVLVERDGEPVELTVTPRKPFHIFGDADAKVGLDIFSRAEELRPVVANVVPGTPAAALNMPRGSLVLAIDDQAVADWFDVVEALRSAAGGTVKVRYRSGDDEVVGEMSVPSSIVNELNLPPTAVVWAIDGVKSTTIRDSNDKQRELNLPLPLALRKLLEQKVGQTVTVRFSRTLRAEPETAEFTVRPDNVDPWQMRLLYAYDMQGFEPKAELVRTSNPLKALWMGVNVVRLQVIEVYQFLKHLTKGVLKRKSNLSVKHVAGPVGIVGVAIQRAKEGTSELLFFLAFLSVNLAVLNFLPIPVLDGGLMIFLIIERIKGKPLSLKTQMISTIVGLTVIVVGILFVTIQDIGRWF
jgi:regulator of sigma E protease